MSSQGIEGFYEKVMNDNGLQEQFKAAGSEDSFVQLAVDLGSKHGFTFTADDVRARLASGQAESSNAELSDRELEQVAGGYVSFGTSLLCGYCGKTSGTTTTKIV